MQFLLIFVWYVKKKVRYSEVEKGERERRKVE
jgi:hypothetical protein